MTLIERHREFLQFAVVGAAAAAVDAGTLFLAINLLQLDPYSGRVISYLCAASFAWAVNRRVTFRNADRRGFVWQWLRYLVTGLSSGLINYGAFAVLVAGSERMPLPPMVHQVMPYIAVGCGSLAGLLINFALIRRIVFRPQQS